jgi:uncharacterized protein (TIGR02246 family)
MKTELRTDVDQIEEILRRIEAAENAGNSAAVVDMLADDAVIMAPNEPVQEGKTACANFLKHVMASLWEAFDRRITYVSAEVRVIGDVAFDRGAFSFTVAARSGGPTSRESGKYLFLYSRGASGVSGVPGVNNQWKIARAIVSLDDRGEESSR